MSHCRYAGRMCLIDRQTSTRRRNCRVLSQAWDTLHSCVQSSSQSVQPEALSRIDQGRCYQADAIRQPFRVKLLCTCLAGIFLNWQTSTMGVGLLVQKASPSPNIRELVLNVPATNTTVEAAILSHCTRAPRARPYCTLVMPPTLFS